MEQKKVFVEYRRKTRYETPEVKKRTPFERYENLRDKAVEDAESARGQLESYDSKISVSEFSMYRQLFGTFKALLYKARVFLRTMSQEQLDSIVEQKIGDLRHYVEDQKYSEKQKISEIQKKARLLELYDRLAGKSRGAFKQVAAGVSRDGVDDLELIINRAEMVEE